MKSGFICWSPYVLQLSTYAQICQEEKKESKHPIIYDNDIECDEEIEEGNFQNLFYFISRTHIKCDEI